MKRNNRRFRILGRIIDAGYDSEKAIVAMTMHDMLTLPGITVSELTQLDELQTSIRANKVIMFLADHPEKKVTALEGIEGDKNDVENDLID
ncbi:MAG: hypothetical protein RSA63_05475 [Eubacterium sp.]